ncbi:MAG: PAS domain S-box protein [Bacteroidetes bacterium]|nr:PAS domain S-box protein [Bacteroidota bacterium]
MEKILTLDPETEKLYKNLFEKNPSCIYIYNCDTHRILDVNEATINTYGYTKDEFLKMSVKDLCTPEDSQKLENAVRNLIEDYKTGIWRHRKKSGEIITVEIKSVKISFKGQDAVISIPNDITEKVKKEEEINKLNANLILLNEDLRNNEVRLKAAQEAGKIGYWEYNFKDELYYISDALFKIFGIPYKPGPVKRDVLTPKVHPDDLSIVRGAVLQAQLYSEFNDYTYRIISDDGSYKYVYTKGEVVKDKNGLPEKIFGVSMDITEREIDRQELVRHSNNIDIILRSITDIFYIVDRNFFILFANEAVEKLTGLSKEELQGKNVWKIFEDVDLSIPKKYFQIALEDNKATQFDMEYHGIIFRVFIYPSEIGLAVSGKDVTEHVRTQQELSQQVNNINIILASITDPFFIIDNNYNFIFANSALVKLTGHELNELIGKKLWPIFIQQNEDFTNLRRGLEKSLKEKVTAELEFTYSGRTFYTHVYPSEIGLAVSCSDITTRKKSEEELKLSTKFIKQISDTMPGVIFQTEYDKDFNARFNYISRKVEEFTGYTAEEILNDYKKHLSAIHKDDLESFNIARNNIANFKGFTVKYRYINSKTSETKWVRVTAIPSRLSNGNIIANGILLDISESENYYNELEKSNQRYEYISQATNETIWDMDVKTSIVTLGGAYKEMYGTSFPNNQIDGYEAEKFIHPDDIQQMLDQMAEVVANRKNFLEERYRLCRADGSIIYVYERGYIFYEEGSNIPVRILGTMQDVTALKLAEIEREKIITDLMKRNKAHEQFSYIVSHNIRAPLANILGLCTMFNEDSIDAETKQELISMILTSSNRLDEVVKDMNQILIINKNFDEKKTEVFFDTILEEVKKIEEHGIKKSDIKIMSDFKKSSSIFAVKSSVQSIFQNLISNSIKFKKVKEPQIKITSDADNDFVYLTFEDNGIGFNYLKHRDKIFGLYNKFHLETEGKGVGLFMVKKQVENLDGEISVESEINKGTKFLIKLKKENG